MSTERSLPPVTSLQANVLAAVDEAGLADMRGVVEAYETVTGESTTEPSIQNHLNTLVAKELLKTTSTPTERGRGRRYRLTDDGREVLDRDG